jgi:iron-sulfur cluster assembly protein
MVTLTNDAVTAIHTLTGQPDTPLGTGLRMAADPDRGALTLSLAVAPVDGDQIVESSGARLFLDPGAAMALDDKTLDATTEPDGMKFTITE